MSDIRKVDTIAAEVESLKYLGLAKAYLTRNMCEFVDSVIAQYERSGYLTDKQWAVVRRILDSPPDPGDRQDDDLDDWHPGHPSNYPKD